MAALARISKFLVQSLKSMIYIWCVFYFLAQVCQITTVWHLISVSDVIGDCTEYNFHKHHFTVSKFPSLNTFKIIIHSSSQRWGCSLFAWQQNRQNSFAVKTHLPRKMLPVPLLHFQSMIPRGWKCIFKKSVSRPWTAAEKFLLCCLSESMRNYLPLLLFCLKKLVTGTVAAVTGSWGGWWPSSGLKGLCAWNYTFPVRQTQIGEKYPQVLWIRVNGKIGGESRTKWKWCIF